MFSVIVCLGTVEFYYVTSAIQKECKHGILTSTHVGGAIEMAITFELLLLAGIFVLMIVVMKRVTSTKAADTLQMLVQSGLSDM